MLGITNRFAGAYSHEPVHKHCSVISSYVLCASFPSIEDHPGFNPALQVFPSDNLWNDNLSSVSDDPWSVPNEVRRDMKVALLGKGVGFTLVNRGH